MKETREVIILLYFTENATLKQTLNKACHTAQPLASSVRELTGTLQSHPFKNEPTVHEKNYFLLPARLLEKLAYRCET